MNTTTTFQGSLSNGQRTARLAGGAAMILFAMFHGGPFASVALLPLLAVYPITTGLIGADPVYLLWQKFTGRQGQSDFHWVSRLLAAATAAGLIGTVMALQQPPGWLSVLALVAVYPALAAIIGRDPFNAFEDHGTQNNVVAMQPKGKNRVSHDSHRKAA